MPSLLPSAAGEGYSCRRLYRSFNSAAAAIARATQISAYSDSVGTGTAASSLVIVIVPVEGAAPLWLK